VQMIRARLGSVRAEKGTVERWHGCPLPRSDRSKIAELFGTGDAPTSPIPSEMTEGLEGRSSSRITGTDC